MKSAPVALTLLTLGLCAAVPLAQGAAPHTAGKATPASRTLAIIGVTVIACTDDPPRPNSTVLIENGRITAIGDTGKIPVPAGARKLDGRGRYLIPGLWDMHAHVVDDSFRQLFLAAGVTGVRHLFSANPFYSPRNWKRPGSPPAPRLVAADKLLDGEASIFSWPVTRNVAKALTVREAQQAVRRLHKEGVDCLKVHAGLSRAAWAAAVAEARLLGLPVVGHIPYEVTAAEVSKAGQASIEHLSDLTLSCSGKENDLRKELLGALRRGVSPSDVLITIRLQVRAQESYDPVKAKALFSVFKRNGTHVVPTLVMTRGWSRLDDEDFCADARLKQLPALVRRLWTRKKTKEGITLPWMSAPLSFADLASKRRVFAQEKKLTQRLHDAGVVLLAGTDTPTPYSFPGSGLHDELELLVEAGLSPLAALQTATRNPALFLGRQKKLGTVEVGKLADLVLLEANPLVYIGNTRKISAVILGGRLLGKDADPTKGPEKSRKD